MNGFTHARWLGALLALAVCAPSAGVYAQDEANPRRLFPYQAPLAGGGDGLCRVRLNAVVLGRAQANLSDVRILRDDGTEVPYLVDTIGPWPSDAPAMRTQVVPKSIARRRVGRDVTEEIRFQIPDDVLPPGSAWSLELGSVQTSFVRSYVIARTDQDDAESGSVFRLTAPARARLDVPLNGVAPGVEYSITLTGQGSYLEPTLTLVAGPMSDRTTRINIPLEVSDTPPSDMEGVTSYVVVRPPGVSPTHLVFATRSAFFSRVVRVYDIREGEDPVLVGERDIFRAPEVGAEILDIPLSRSRGGSWRIDVLGGQSGPLLGLDVSARTEQPALLFECTEQATLYAGGDRTRVPHYDVQRFAGSMLGDAMARGNVSTVDIGELVDNPSFDQSPALEYLLQAGATVDRTTFRSVAPVTVSGAEEGVSRLALSAGILSRVDPEVQRFRVVDFDGRQWPIVVAPGESEVEVPIAIDPVDMGDLDGRTSTYLLRALPGPLALESVQLETESAAFVRRQYRAQVLDEDDAPVGPEVTGELIITPSEVQNRITLPNIVGNVRLTIENGDDSRLELAASGRATTPTLYLLAPNGSFSLLADGDAPPFAYEVQHALPLILAAEVVDARIGNASDNPDFTPPPIPPKFSTEQIAVWAMLGIAVLVLGFLTLRVSREPLPVAEAAKTPTPPTTGGAPEPGADPEGATDAPPNGVRDEDET